MALRNVMKNTKDDDVLRKKARTVTNISKSICSILADMSETMRSENGIGLAANQVGVLKRLVVIDVGEGLIQLVNPVIVKSSGEQTEAEGCLSVPDMWGLVKRPLSVVVKAYDETGKRIEIKGEGLLARVLCHEIDHLDGTLFIDKAEPGTLGKIATEESGL